jgi:NitT/TauT family transport system substrate-binding protein
MDASDVQVVHLESNEQPRAFEQGKVDGAVTFDPFRAQFLKAGAKVLFDSTQIPGEIVDLVAVRASMLERKPKGIQALLKGWFEAIAYLKREPADAARRMGIRQQASGEQFAAGLAGLHITTRDENIAMIGGASPQLAATGKTLMTLMVDAKLLRSAIPIEKVLAPAPILSMER